MSKLIFACTAALGLAACADEAEEEPVEPAATTSPAPVVEEASPSEDAEENAPTTGADTMIRGGNDTVGTRPPKNSKLQRAD